MIVTTALRYLSGRKLRTLLTTLAVIFGVMVIFGMNILIPSMLKGFQANVMAAAGIVDVTVTQKTGVAFDASAVDKVKAVEGVSAVSPVLNRAVNLPADYFDHDPAKRDTVTAVNLVGIDPPMAQAVHAYMMQSGRFFETGDTSAAIISESMASLLGLKAGDTLALPTTQGETRLTIVGLLPARTSPGNEEVLLPLSEMQSITGQPGQINAIEANLDIMDETARRQIEGQIESALGDSFQIGGLPSGSEVFASLTMGQTVLNLFGAMALFMGGFIIFNTFRTVVAERRRDIGMLRAIGASRGTITGMNLVEGLLQGAIGTAIGMLAGLLMSIGILKAISGVMAQFVHINIEDPVIAPGLVVACSVLGVGITVLAGLIPAVNASRVTPMEALRPSVADVEKRRVITVGTVTGIVLAVLAFAALVTQNIGLVVLGSFLFLGALILLAPVLVAPIASLFGKVTALAFARQGVGHLAEGNLSRQPSRAAITASTTMIGLAIIVAASGLTTSMMGFLQEVTHRSLGSDYLMVPPSVGVWSSDLGAGSDLTGRIRQVEAVGDISTFRFAASQVNDQAVSMLGIDPETFPRVSSLTFTAGDESAYGEIASRRAVIVNSGFLTATGAKLGDTIELATPNGKQAYQIAAVAVDLLNAKMTTAYISQANLKADFGKTEDVFIQFNLKPGVDRAAADKQIREIALDYPQFNLISGQAYLDDLMAQMNAAFSGMYVMLAFLAFPSVIAMLNTLAIGVIERTREIGMIRAVGGTRSQVHTMVLIEAILLAALGTAFGLLGGIYLGYAMMSGISTLFPAAYSFPLVGS